MPQQMFVMQHMPKSPAAASSRSCSSPANSEISVGSPSPPPSAVRPIHGKRLRLLRSPTPTQSSRRSSQPGERIKSFSIADILGRSDDIRKPASPTLGAAPTQLLSDRLQAPPLAKVATPLALPLLPPPAPQLLWDPAHPFLPPALLHSYEQRLAWDYQRQLQEHFQAQAQMLRQMSMDPAIIPSEDGSERSRSRSRSSSNGSTDCCSPTEPGEATLAKQSVSSTETGRKEKSVAAVGDTPLDALFQLSTKNFDDEQDPATLNIFATRSNPKKKRKSRTAFSNQQIFELEKRFLYQKYLSPADRDEIASGLGLSNAQVITWFQNRRAKLKRDMEELKKDVSSVKQLPDQSADSLRSQRHSQMLLAVQSASQQSSRNNNPNSNNNSNPNSADKEELRMLKLMTLMRYSDGKILYPYPQSQATRPTT